MNTKNNRVDFIGFTPDASQKWLVQAAITKLLDKAPFRSTLRAVVCSEAEGFSLKIKLSSFEHHFETYCSASDLFELLGKVEVKMNEQINEWKKTRFAQEISG